MMQENRTSLRVPADTTVQKTMSRRHVTTLESSDWTRLELRDVSKSFVDASGHNVSVLSNISLTIDRGDFYCLLGPSGCGKSTLLDMISGFEEPSAGTICYRGGHEAPWSRSIGSISSDRVTIFQDANQALFPWMTAEENVMFGPRMAGMSRARARDEAREYLGIVNLTESATKFPYQLSGGMRQRLQLARSLIMKPQLLLMDEPFGALDAITRRSLQGELTRIWHDTGATIVFITHDITESLLLGNRVALMTIGPSAKIFKELAIDLGEPRTPTDAGLVKLQQVLERDMQMQLDKVARIGHGTQKREAM